MKICAVSGKTFQSGNNVSHAENKTRRRFNANIQKKRLFSNVLGFCSLRITSKGIKIIESYGGLDEFLTNAKVVYGDGIELQKRFVKAKEKAQLVSE
jgi:large subunit ribosomal protein L28